MEHALASGVSRVYPEGGERVACPDLGCKEVRPSASGTLSHAGARRMARDETARKSCLEHCNANRPRATL